MDVVSLYWPVLLAVTVVGYWALPRHIRGLWLSGLTACFLAVVAPVSAGLLLAFTAGTYALASGERPPAWRLLVAGVAILVVLVYYKLQIRFRLDDFSSFTIPLGLSYYAFRCLHYLIERYKGRVPTHSFLDFANYLLFLPTLIVGPIHRFSAFHRDKYRQRWDPNLISEGLERILYGYVKITFLANFLISVQMSEAIETLLATGNALVVYLTVLQKGLNGYLLFSGYSDIAIGFALTLGYRVMENFKWPLLQRNIANFWRSWHISLSSWCRDYVYMVVFSMTRHPALAAIASMLVLGLWHEISYRYVLWGLYNGLGIMVWQKFRDFTSGAPKVGLLQGTVFERVSHAASVVLTFHFVMFGFVLVQEPNLAAAGRVYTTLLLFWR